VIATMSELGPWRRTDRSNAVILGLLGVLVLTNLWQNSTRFEPSNLPSTIGLAAPTVLVAMASVPAILGGGGGLDISLGPMVGLLNVVIVKEFIVEGHSNPALIIGAALVGGAALGAINGAVVVGLRLQPIVATLATYLIFAGLSPWVMRSPEGFVPDWLARFSDELSFVPFLIAVVMWLLFRLAPAHGMLLAVGGSDRAAYASAVPVGSIRFLSYVLGGALAGTAALALTALIGSGDPSIGPTFTLKALAAVALGGVSLAGGRGGLLNAAIGATVLFQLELLLTGAGVSSFVLRIVYGSVLLSAVVVNSLLRPRAA